MTFTLHSALRTPHFVLFLLLVATCCGCSTTASLSPSTAKTATVSINLVRADAAALDELIAKHKGKVVLVDYWATWCLPCVEGFPHTVELAKQHRDAGLATIAVNFDLLDEEPNVRKFLAEKGANFDNLISKHDAIGQKPAEDFDITALPQYRLYDRQGKLRQKWEGTPDGIEEMIQKLLAEMP